MFRPLLLTNAVLLLLYPSMFHLFVIHSILCTVEYKVGARKDTFLQLHYLLPFSIFPSSSSPLFPYFLPLSPSLLPSSFSLSLLLLYPSVIAGGWCVWVEVDSSECTGQLGRDRRQCDSALKTQGQLSSDCNHLTYQ